MDNINNLLFDNNKSDLFENKYISHYNYSSNHPHDQQYSRDIVRQDIQVINSNLQAYGVPKMGNLFSSQTQEIDKTINVIKTFISLRQKELDFKNETFNKLKKLENEKNTLINANERLTKQKHAFQAEKETFTKKIKNIQRTYKQNTQKIIQEKEQTLKQFIKMTNKEGQYNNQIRKKDNLIKQLQQTIKKMQVEKVTYKNSVQITAPLELTGPSIYYVNAQHEFSQLVQKNYQEMYERYNTENKYFRESLSNMYKELNQILELKKDMLIRRRSFEDQDVTDIHNMNLSNFKIELLNMPVENSKEAVEMLDDNLKKFKEYMDKLDTIGNFDHEFKGMSQGDTDKIKSVKKIKDLIKNYKFIVQAQDQMLNKVIVKAKEFKVNDIALIDNKYSKCLDDDEIDKAKRFLEEQKNYLELKNRQIQTTKKSMVATLRKVEEEKNEMIKKKRQIEEEGLKLKKNIESLPSQLEREY